MKKFYLSVALAVAIVGLSEAGGVVIRAPFVRVSTGTGFSRGAFPVGGIGFSRGIGFAPVYRQRVILSAPVYGIGGYSSVASYGIGYGTSYGLSTCQAPILQAPVYAPAPAVYSAPTPTPAVLEERITTVERYSSGGVSSASALAPAMSYSSGAGATTAVYSGTDCPAGVNVSQGVGSFLATLPVAQQQAYLEARYAPVFGRGVGIHIHRRFFPGGVFRRR